MKIETEFKDLGPLPATVLDEDGYETVLAQARRVLDVSSATVHDVIIHNVRVRLHTNNPHWQKFWSLNWFAPDQWMTLTGQRPSKEPQIHVYAVLSQEQTGPRASYNRQHSSAFLSGDLPYGPLRTITLRAVSDVLADEQGVHYVEGLCIKKAGKTDEKEYGSLLLGLSDQEKTKRVDTLLEQEKLQLVSWDGVFVRYGLVRMVDGVTLLPTLVIDEKGNEIPGYHLFPWLHDYGYLEPRADARCLTLQGEETFCFARDLDLGRAPEAFAYPVEQAWYIPTQLVAHQPQLIGPLWEVPWENVPAVQEEIRERYEAWARQVIPTLTGDIPPSTRTLVETTDAEEIVEALCRLRGAGTGRALVPPAQLWPARTSGHPGRPMPILRVELYRGNTPVPIDTAALVEHLSDLARQQCETKAPESIQALADVLRLATTTIQA
jgi:hypothetical protein